MIDLKTLKSGQRLYAPQGAKIRLMPDVSSQVLVTFYHKQNQYLQVSPSQQDLKQNKISIVGDFIRVTFFKDTLRSAKQDSRIVVAHGWVNKSDLFKPVIDKKQLANKGYGGKDYNAPDSVFEMDSKNSGLFESKYGVGLDTKGLIDLSKVLPFLGILAGFYFLSKMK